MTSDAVNGETGRPPEYDQPAVSRVASRVQIRDIELLGAHYERADDDASMAALPADSAPNFGINVEWALADNGAVLVCVITFGTIFDDAEEPYSIVARFRLAYVLDDEAGFQEGDLNQFAHWNAVFNAWPYWREFVSSIADRGRLPRLVVPVMGIPSSSSSVVNTGL